MNELKSNGLDPSIAQAIEEMEAELGKTLLTNEINLAELQRRTGYSRGKVRWFKHKLIACCSNLPIKQKSSTRPSVIEGNDDYCDLLNRLLKQGITNSVVCFQRLQHIGYRGSLASVKRYITKHKDLVPAKRYLVAPQGSRGRRFSTSPGEAFQMDWGFTKVECPNGEEYRVESYLPNDRQTTVRPDSMVIYMNHKYSVPADYIGKPVRLLVAENNLQIYYSTEIIAVHTLSEKRFNYKKEHYQQLLSRYIKDQDVVAALAEDNLKQMDMLL